jgi:hypothetical protein
MQYALESKPVRLTKKKKKKTLELKEHKSKFGGDFERLWSRMEQGYFQEGLLKPAF